MRRGHGRGSRRVARPSATERGFASIVGAGPGSPDLLTLRAADRLRAADLVLFDGLVPPAVLAMAERAELVSVARRHGPKTMTQDEVCDRIIAGARAGRRVVRLKAGDPFVFGRGGEEVEALVAAGVPFEVVPGLSSAFAAPAAAGIPVTHRGVAAAVVVVSGHAPDSYGPVVDELSPGSATVVVLMGLAARRAIARRLIAAGWAPATPAAVIVSASQPHQRMWSGQLSTLGVRDGMTARTDPGVIVVGAVVGLAPTVQGTRKGQRSTHGSPR